MARGGCAVLAMAQPVAAAGPLARFRRKIADNARGWLTFVQGQRADNAALEREFANLGKAAEQALLEPEAREAGVALVVALWPFVELRGRWPEWRGLLNLALSVCRRLDRPEAEAQVHDQLGELARILGNYQDAWTRQEEALAICRRLGNRAGEGRVLGHLSQQYLALGDHEAAERCCQEAAAIFEGLGDQAELATVHNNWGLVCRQNRRLDEALSHHQQAEVLRAALGDLHGQAKAMNNVGQIYRQMGRLAEAAACIQQAIAIHQQVGDDVVAARTRVSLAIVAHERGHTAEALAMHLEVEPLFRRLGVRSELGNVLNNQGVFLAALNRPEQAQTAYEEAVRLHLANGDRIHAADSLNNCAELLLDHGMVAVARERLEQAHALLQALAGPPGWLLKDHATLAERATNAVGPG